jgi:hypothetical protein
VAVAAAVLLAAVASTVALMITGGSSSGDATTVVERPTREPAEARENSDTGDWPAGKAYSELPGH